MVMVVNTRPMIKNAANPTKDGVLGLKQRLRNLENQKKETGPYTALYSQDVTHNNAIFAPGEKEEKRPSFGQLPNKDETIEKKWERKEQNPNENTANLQDADLNAASDRWTRMKKNLKDLKKEGFEPGKKSIKQLLERAIFSPSSKDPNDPVCIIRAFRKKEKTDKIIPWKNLSARQADSLLDDNSRFLKVPGFGKIIKNRRPDRRKRKLQKDLRKAIAAGVKNALSDR